MMLKTPPMTRLKKLPRPVMARGVNVTRGAPVLWDSRLINRDGAGKYELFLKSLIMRHSANAQASHHVGVDINQGEVHEALLSILLPQIRQSPFQTAFWFSDNSEQPDN